VPSATNADHATNADRAKNADHASAADSATSAATATSATNATNADQLGGVAGALYPHSVRQVDVATALDSNSPKFITASCDLGEKVLGGGGFITNGTLLGAQHVSLHDTQPSQQFGSTPGGYTVKAYETISDDGTWSVTARVICALGG
jgi:hypothetical protein